MFLPAVEYDCLAEYYCFVFEVVEIIFRVNVIVRRVGGAYGSKISRQCQIACAAALVSHLQGKTCRFVMSIEDNMRVVGKRVPTYCNFEVR